MRAAWSSLSLKSLLLAGALSAVHSYASPSINVALRASFNSAPYLVELLETAAQENSTAYFPILDRIAEGYFKDANSDKELYTLFTELLQKDGHLTDADTLASFRFALSVHSAAPRIEAHYQFYNTSVEPSISGEEKDDCEVWVAFGDSQYCSPRLDEGRPLITRERTDELPFDRILGESSNALPSILYADVTSPAFAKFHQTISRTARDGKTSYRVRYKPTPGSSRSPLVVNGYGIELALKRTDYIVIDDRQAEQSGHKAAQQPLGGELHDEDVADLKPLSASELSALGLNAASFVTQSDQPLDTLLKLVQDFPKHSAAISAHNASEEFLKEYRANREQFLPAGVNVIWINGVQVPARDIDPFTLIDHLRGERELINNVRDLGLSAPEAIGLLSHSAISLPQTEDEPQRYDFRDETEGGHVIMWLNNIEKDKRYEDWPENVMALLQRTFPGQLPPVRKDIHNAIVPIDFTVMDHVGMVVDTVRSLITRKIPLQWGLVPLTATPNAEAQAKVVYYLLESHGLASVMSYLTASIKADKLSSPDKPSFESAVKSHKLRKDRTGLSFEEALNTDAEEQLTGAKKYLARLAADGPNAPLFVNGVPVPRNDEWLNTLSQRISIDLREIQKGVFEEIFTQDSWLPSFFLFQASLKRNPLVIPENEKDVALYDLEKILSKEGAIYNGLPRIPADTSVPDRAWAHLIVAADFSSPSGKQLLSEAVEFRKAQQHVELIFVHNPGPDSPSTGISEPLFRATEAGMPLNIQNLETWLANYDFSVEVSDESKTFWGGAQAFLKLLDINAGESTLILNGRRVGPIPENRVFSKDDLEFLLNYEVKKRIGPTYNAARELGISHKISTPEAFAKLSSLVALSTVSDVPEGIFEQASTVRMDLFKKWNSTHTSITKGDIDSSIIQIVASIDPATELAQRWVPTLKALSELDGVHLRLFLNPKEKLDELPVKRFYRYVLDSQPTFNEDGSLVVLKAEFTGIPSQALLTMGMDVPPSWLVAPEESIYDLDNIKLSTLSPGASIDVIYELENILIEGHSRDTMTQIPPRGAELVLSTEKDPHFDDTIIMANLGYFQFKANPGFFRIQLKKGRSQEIFNIDSAGTKGWAPQPGDETTELALMSFQGTTLFPRLSRKPGQEDADVLAPAGGVADDLVEKGTQLANKILSKVGLSNTKADSAIKKGSKIWSSVLSSTGLHTDIPRSGQADINIFSVASGHLYERMLNIMMLSVMKHTKHTVKFWFIEQFLSPSFKSFLPTMAAAYGFDYEMVTYKWPHWLRGQKEKQREIWGYKILFLDVLFPLDLDKVIFVDADQIVRTDMYNLVTLDLHGAPYGFTPMCDSRTEMEGFRFWKQGYWKNFLQDMPYHISALYVVDLKRFRQLAAGDRLRQQYHTLSADPNSLSNLDQDLPNNMQRQLPIFSLPQEWLWCETWCSDESLKDAKTIDLCNNPQTKEPKLDRARRQVPEWTEYDEEIAGLARRAETGVGGEAEGEGDADGEAQRDGGRRVRDEL